FRLGKNLFDLVGNRLVILDDVGEGGDLVGHVDSPAPGPRRGARISSLADGDNIGVFYPYCKRKNARRRSFFAIASPARQDASATAHGWRRSGAVLPAASAGALPLSRPSTAARSQPRRSCGPSLPHRSPPYPIAHDSRASTMHAAN